MKSGGPEAGLPSAAAWALTALLLGGVLTIWAPGRQAAYALETAVLALGVASSLWLAWKRPAVRGHALLIPLAGAAAWGLVQLAAGYTIYRFATWTAVWQWTAALVVFFVGLEAFRREEIRRRVRAALVVFAFLIAVVALTQLFTSEGQAFWVFETGYRDNVLGPFVNRNNYAAFVELLLPFALLEALRQRGRMAWGGAAAALYASVIASGSRAGAALATLEVVAVALLWWGRERGRGRLLGSAVARLAVMLAAAVMVAGWDVLIFRLRAPGAGDPRPEFALSSLEMIRQRPWSGFGLGAWPSVYPAFASIDQGYFVNHAHNDWLEWGAEGGLPFLLLMISVAAWSVRPALRSIWGVGLLAVFLHALVDYPFARPGLALWPFAVLAMLAADQAAPALVDGGRGPDEGGH